MKKYKVWARMTTILYVFVEASDAEEAWGKAVDMDGSEFIPLDQGIVQNGDWNIYSIEEVTND
jgi:hypothetical protein